MLAALRYRRAQAVVLVLLSALVTASLVLAPLYTRALEQAVVRTSLAAATAEQAGLRLSSTSPTEPQIAPPPDDLEALVPETVRGYFGTAVDGTAVDVRRMPLVDEPGGRLLAREGMCTHVRFTAGRCPARAGEVAVSGAQAQAYGNRLGTRLAVGEWDAAVSRPEASPHTTLLVVGVYAQPEDPYWFGDSLTGQAAARLGLDTMLTPAETLTGEVDGPDGKRTTWFQPVYSLDLPLRSGRVGIDDIGALGATVRGLVQYPMGVERSASHAAETITVRSGLPAIADEVRRGSEQASVTIPLLMAQIGLLLVCVTWLVLVAAADQRRGEVAVARLRGRGSRGARRLLLAETLPPVVLGAPLGALLAVAASTVARHTVLTSDPPFEVPAAAALALALGLVLVVGLAVLSVGRVCREPVAALVRSVPPRRTGIRLGVLEAMLVAAAAAAFAALVTGSVRGPVGEVAPTLLALAVGIVAARVLAFLLAAGGARLLRLGRPTAGAALLSASRRGTTRWLVPVVTVALCIVVVTVDALAVGVRNWAGRGAAEVGAATVLTLDSADLSAVTRAVRAVDPRAEHVTPVAVVQPPEPGGPATVGVVPEAFRRVALWPGAGVEASAWARLTAPTTPPLAVTGRRVTYRITSTAFEVVQPETRPRPTALVLALRVVHADGTVDAAPLGTLPAAGLAAEQQQATLDCADGCRISGVGVLTPAGTQAVNGAVTLTALAVDGRPVDLDGGDAWRENTGAEAGSGRASPVAGGLRVDYSTNGFADAFAVHASLPDTVPALTTPAATPSARSATFAGSYVDGRPLFLRSEGVLAFVPGGPRSASLVHLDNLLAQGWRGRGGTVLRAYVDTTDPAVVDGVTSGLRARGITVASSTTADEASGAYGRSAAAWSLQLSLVVGLLSLLIAAVGIVVLASTSSRARSRDYAGLRLAGHRTRGLALLAQLETVPVVVASAALGAGVGLWAAPAAVGMVPLFTTPPPTFPVDLTTAWAPALAAGAVGLVGLAVVGVLTSLRVARRADLRRLRDNG